MDYDSDKFAELRDYADHMRTLSGDRDTMLDRMRDIYMLKDADAEMIQDLVLAAVNLALDQARELQQQVMGPLAGGLPF